MMYVLRMLLLATTLVAFAALMYLSNAVPGEFR